MRCGFFYLFPVFFCSISMIFINGAYEIYIAADTWHTGKKHTHENNNNDDDRAHNKETRFTYIILLSAFPAGIKCLCIQYIINSAAHISFQSGDSRDKWVYSYSVFYLVLIKLLNASYFTSSCGKKGKKQNFDAIEAIFLLCLLSFRLFSIGTVFFYSKNKANHFPRGFSLDFTLSLIQLGLETWHGSMNIQPLLLFPNRFSIRYTTKLAENVKINAAQNNLWRQTSWLYCVRVCYQL